LPLDLAHNESINEVQSTINGKANQVASGKFTKEMYDYLVFNIYMYRSYGYVAIEKYEHALEDLRKAKKISPHGIDKATVYNKWLSRGILKMDTEEYLMASKYFGKASMRFPENKDSFCLNAISIVRSYSYSMSTKFIDDLQKKEKVEQTLKFLDVAIKCCCKEQK
jgi:tetratricopeptide (TPR) repeat protein